MAEYRGEARSLWSTTGTPVGMVEDRYAVSGNPFRPVMGAARYPLEFLGNPVVKVLDRIWHRCAPQPVSLSPVRLSRLSAAIICLL